MVDYRASVWFLTGCVKLRLVGLPAPQQRHDASDSEEEDDSFARAPRQLWRHLASGA